MSVKRSNSKQLQDFPGYSGRFSIVHSLDDDREGMDKAYSRNWEPPVDYQDSMDLDKKWPRDIKYHQNYNASTTASTTDHYDSERNPKTAKRVLTRFAERTSMQGVPYINVSKTLYAKLIWVTLFLLALVGMIYHLYVLSSSYLAFTKHTKVQLSFSNIKFPTITVCNVNPLRSSQLDLANNDLRQFVRSIRPDNVASSLKKKRPPPAAAPQTTPPKPKSTQTPPSSGRRKRFIEDLDFNFTNTRREFEEEPGQKKRRPSGQKSNIQEIKREFNYLFSSHDRETRISMGHELSDMLVSCTFSGVVCNASQFRIHPTSTYGNCYTLENADYVSYRSGPINGLELILFLETDEYIPTIASGHGAHIQIHDTNTWPDPELEGMALSAAMETHISMRMIQIERLKMQYGICEDGDLFLAKYGRKYTRQTCQLFCVQEKIVSQCGCYDEEKYELQSSINTDVDRGTIRACRRKADVRCMLSVEAGWETGDFSCPCPNPCNETTFQKVSNSRSWPSDAYARMLVEFLCINKNETECEKYENMDPRILSQNFMKVNIFFEDLNYEQIAEAPDYEDVQFLSDIGGTVGLWIGLSLLSLAEVGQFFVELVHFLLCVKPNRKKTESHRNDVTSRNNNLERSSSADPRKVESSPRLSDFDRKQYVY